MHTLLHILPRTTFFTALLLAATLSLASAQVRPSPVEDSIKVEVNKGRLVHLYRPATTVMVANPDIADVQVLSPTLISLNGRRVGETSIIAVDGRDGEILNEVVEVTHNLSKLKKAMKSMMPDADVEFESVDGALVMRGFAGSPLESENINRIATPFLAPNQKMVNMLTIGGSDQVTLMVKVAEIQRTELKRFGINIEALLNTGNFVFGIAQGRDVFDATTGTFPRSSQDNSLLLNFRTGRHDVTSVIDALEDEGLVTVLAEPSLTTQSGKSANFLAGGEFPIPQVGADGAISIVYKDFGVKLNFTPIVLSKDKISLTVNPEVSTLSQTGSIQASGFNIPSLITRRATTTVELGSGETFSIAGLLQNDHGNDISKYPALGDVPVLGALFRSSEFTHNQTELVILVTPYVVRGVADKSSMATPLDNFAPASDLERILFGKLYSERPAGQQPPPDAEDTPHLNGPAGFIIR